MVTENWEQESIKDKPVYFIMDDEAIAVKIGVADSPQSRLRELQFGNPHKLRLGKIIENGGYDLEQKLHRLFTDYALGNEWFHLTKEIEGYIEKGRFPIEDHGKASWAHPVVSAGRLYVRNLETLSCYDIRAQKK